MYDLQIKKSNSSNDAEYKYTHIYCMREISKRFIQKRDPPLCALCIVQEKLFFQSHDSMGVQ